MSPADHRSRPTFCFSVFAAAEASVMPRVLELFAKRGLAPKRFEAAIAGSDADELTIDVQADGLEAETAEHIAQCMRQIVHVDRVLTAIKARAFEPATARDGGR
jgi:acetolactate synthase small subunit